MTNDRHLPEATGGIVLPLFRSPPQINSVLSYISRNSLLANINALACMNNTSVGKNSFGKPNSTIALAKALQAKHSWRWEHRMAARCSREGWASQTAGVSSNTAPGARAAEAPAHSRAGPASGAACRGLNLQVPLVEVWWRTTGSAPHRPAAHQRQPFLGQVCPAADRARSWSWFEASWKRLSFVIRFTSVRFDGYKVGTEIGSRIRPISFPKETSQCKVTHRIDLHYTDYISSGLSRNEWMKKLERLSFQTAYLKVRKHFLLGFSNVKCIC